MAREPASVPVPKQASVPRLSRVGELLGAATGRAAVVGAPAGYGKSTQVRAWAAGEIRPVVWADLDVCDNDPRVLVPLLCELLRGVGVAVDDLPPMSTTDHRTITSIAPLLGRMVRRATSSFVLVLDDVHVITDPTALDVIDAIAANIAAESTVILVGRSEPAITLGRLRAECAVVDVTTTDLALRLDEARHLLDAMDVDVDDHEVERLLSEVEGWPVGIRFAGTALVNHVRTGAGRSGDQPVRHDAAMDAYVRDEWVRGMSDDDAEFLTHVSFLDRLSGPVCDHVLRRSDCGERLRMLDASTLLVVPIDRRGDEYRLHHVLRDALAAAAERTDRAGHRRRHARASVWFERTGDIDRAVLAALGADDLDRAEGLVVEHAAAHLTTGRHSTVRRWIELMPRPRRLANARLCAAAGVTSLGEGDRNSALTWLRFGEHAHAATGPNADPAVGHELVTVRALLDERATTSADLARAYGELPPGVWQTSACLAYGIREALAGNSARAAALFADGASSAHILGATTVEAQCLANHSVVLAASGENFESVALARRAGRLVRDRGFDEIPTLVMVTSVGAMVEAIDGNPAHARDDAALTRRHLPHVAGLSTWVDVQARIALAEAYVNLGDRVAARTVLREATGIATTNLSARRLRPLIAEIASRLHLGDDGLLHGPSSLTSAELRVLQFLPTNLTLAQIAQRLYVSRNTAKSHTTAVYRKLGVSSRGEAVELACTVGLVPATSFRPSTFRG